LIGVALVGALLLGLPLIALFVLDRTGSSGPDMQTVGFGTGGSECSLTDVASSFQLGVPIRSVLTFSPALPAGGTVTISVEHDGTELVDRRQTLTLDEPAPCVYGTMTPDEVGHYRVRYTIEPSTMAPMVGEFDVTP
jgi:hypothetical protein